MIDQIFALLGFSDLHLVGDLDTLPSDIVGSIRYLEFGTTCWISICYHTIQDMLHVSFYKSLKGSPASEIRNFRYQGL